jgi:glycosyltransferase involved in cell wall biosynthesis
VSGVAEEISVVITTFERPEACERALRSVLAQSASPLEILVCDNGSNDETGVRFARWEANCANVRYLRLPRNSGTPAPARNLGIAHARGDWIAFLDDDDEWLPEKLARQRQAIARTGADVIATNALRRNGARYFPAAPEMHRPSRAELLAANPVIVSSALVRRGLAGFPTAARLKGIEDYAAWLALADRGAEFLVLGEPLIRYDDAGEERMSAARTQMELRVARLAWARARRSPADGRSITAAIRKTAGVMYVAASDGFAAVRSRVRRRRTTPR